MADIKIGAKSYSGIKKLNFPLSDGSGYAQFSQGGGGEELVEFSQMNPLVAEYMANVTYDPSDYTVSNVSQYSSQTVDYRKDQPTGCIVNLKNDGKLGLCDGNRANHADSAAGENEIVNLTPNEVGKWWNEVDGNIEQCGTVKPTGQVRMIKLGAVRNVRDLGGWACDGGTVKYGKLFRGGMLFSSSTGSVITDPEIEICRNFLGIQHEIDFRVHGEGTTTESVLGSDVMYSNVPLGVTATDYVLALDLDGLYPEKMKTIISKVFESVKYGRPTYMHCTYGADRTAIVSFILNGLLGVSQGDLDKDFELSSFYTIRKRTADSYRGLIEYFKACSTGNMRDCIVAWCVLLGISIDDINEFRANMIDGTPETVTANINYTCNDISLAETSLNVSSIATLTAFPSPSWTTDSITWESGDTAIATVVGNGKTATITGVANGTTTITAKCGNYSAICDVTVELSLPSEYEAVAYIDHPSSTTNIAQNAYCDLGITGRTGLVIKGKALIYSSKDAYMVGSTNSSNQRIITGNMTYIGSASTFGMTAGVFNADAIFEFNTTVNNSYLYVNVNSAEHTSQISNTTAFDNGVTMALFCRNKSGTYERPIDGRLYWLTIEENGEEIMNLLPCRRKSDSVVGLYDTVGKTFITSANSVAFVAGE